MNIAALLDIAADVYDDRVALGRRAEGLTYRQLADVTSVGAGILSEAGPKSVAFVGLNGPAVPELLFSSARAGIPFAPLNYRLSVEQLVWLLADLESPLLVADAEYLHVAEVAGVPVLPTEEFVAQTRKATAEAVTGPDEGTAVVLFTSGTTSDPKGVVLRHEQLTAYVLQTVELAGGDPDDAIIVSVPPYHVAGMGTVLTNVYGGRRIVYLPEFEPGRWLELVRDEGVTNAMVVPTMLARIVSHLHGASAGTPTLRSIAYGGARMPGGLVEKAMAAFPQVGFVNAYGLTETSSTIAVLGPEDHVAALSSGDPAVRARLSSAGRPVPGIEVEVRDPEGRAVGVGETGELWVRGPQVSGEYRHQGSTLDPAGWFCTRDLARIDEDGFLFIEGRADDTIIRGGENIAPVEIEAVLERHPSVADVAVVGLPDEEWGQRLVAVVVPAARDHPSSDDLRQFVRSHLRGSKTPDEVRFADELPYGPTGKLLRRQLVAKLAPGGA